LWLALHQAYDVVRLLTVVPERSDSWMFHHPGVEWVSLHAEALKIPLATTKASGVKEQELGALRISLSELVASHGIECVVTGAIASEYQRSRIDRICDEVGVRSFAPLWGRDPEDLLREEVEMGFEFIITACMAMGLDSSWLGRIIDQAALDELGDIGKKYRINLAFEGGEAETFVIEGPIFAKRIRITDAQPVWKGESGYLNIARACLEEKTLRNN